MSDSINLYNREQVYQLDKLAMSLDAQSSQQLMGRAAQACWNEILLRQPQIRRIVVFAGSGNNGGDGFALAMLALRDGYEVDCLIVSALEKQSTAAAFYRQQYEQLGGNIQIFSGRIPDCDVIVDGLLGIGLQRDLDQSWQALIEQINAHNAMCVALDIPSGLNADTGIAQPVAVKADLTVTFIARKIGCFHMDGPHYCGEVLLDELGLSRAAASKIAPVVSALSATQIELPQRPRNAHKNSFGHVLVIGGAPGMSGAVRLAAKAALRSGAGLVSACVHADCVQIVATAQAEVMVSDWSHIDAMLERASVVVVGPGLGDAKAAQQILQKLTSCELPMVIDADALQRDFLQKLSSQETVLTPHPGEAARLLNSKSRAIQSDRLESLRHLLKQFDSTVILKGAGSLIGSADLLPRLCLHGHSGMATAGMGDVLAGIAGGYLAQGLNAAQAAQTAVLVHALAAEIFATEQDTASLIASDVIDRIGKVVGRIRQEQCA